MNLLAAVRPDDWNLSLFLHILGAMVMVGGLVLAGFYLWGAWRRQEANALRPAFRALLWVALPGWLVMRVFAQVIHSKEHLDDLDSDPTWVGIGFITSELGGLLLIAAIVLSGLAARQASVAGGGAKVRVATGLISLLLVAYLVAVWAMTTKPV